MTTALKKSPPGPAGAYKMAAASRRAKVTSMMTPVVGEIKPSQGRIRVTLSGKAISRERQTDGFGPSLIDIPEFSVLRKRKPA